MLRRTHIIVCTTLHSACLYALEGAVALSAYAQQVPQIGTEQQLLAVHGGLGDLGEQQFADNSVILQLGTSSMG
eukprot:5295630-Amphidinium_carterae.1